MAQMVLGPPESEALQGILQGHHHPRLVFRPPWLRRELMDGGARRSALLQGS